MVGSISNIGFQTQIPGATALRPGETNQPTPLDTRESNGSGRVGVNGATQTTLQPGKTEEVASQTALNRNGTRPAPSDPFASNNARGSQLDIRV